MENKTENNNIANISGNNNTKNTINVTNCKTIINNKNGIKDKPLKNITLNCLSAGSCFQGRKKILLNIFQSIKLNKMVVIHGAPGIGKTETARQFTIKNKKYFKGNLIWLFAETEENLKKCFKDLSRTLGLQVTDVSQVYAKFRTSRCLFVFDNVENMASIRKYLPPSHLRETVKILITSQFSKWDSSVSKIPLEALKMEDALQIFNAKLGDEFRENPIKIWEDLVEYLEGIPLSLQIVSSLIKEEFSKVWISQFNLQQFICALKGNFINSEIPESEIINYNKTVFSSIRFTLERLKNEENTSQFLHLLGYMAYLNADNIYHYDLLLFPSIGKSEEKLQIALTKLSQYSLIQVEYVYKGLLKVKIHRTIQHVLREFDLKEQNGSIFKTAIKTLLSGDVFFHYYSIFKYIKEEEFQDKSLEFYDENYIENKAIVDIYLKELAYYNCHVVLQELLSKLKDKYIGIDNYDKIVNELLSNVINYRNNDIRIIDILINYGAKIGISSDGKTNGFLRASSWLSIKLFDRLLETNDSENLINSKDIIGRTILHRLIEYCNKENVEEIIECIDHLTSKWKADISIRDIKNNTILHAACENKEICFQIIKLLVEKCNSKNLVNQQNKWGETPLQCLVIYNNKISDLSEILYYFLKECEVDITIENDRK